MSEHVDLEHWAEWFQGCIDRGGNGNGCIISGSVGATENAEKCAQAMRAAVVRMGAVNEILERFIHVEPMDEMLLKALRDCVLLFDYQSNQLQGVVGASAVKSNPVIERARELSRTHRAQA